MSRTKKIPFVFTLLDYKAMEEYFQMQAAKGWMLEKINSFTMEFKKIQPRHIKFSVDVFPYISAFDSKDLQTAKDYRDLCEKSGWKFITSSNKLQVFYSEDMENPIPLQTDPREEERIIKKAFFSIEVLIMLILFPVLFLSLGSLFPFPYDKLFLNSDIVSTIMLPLLLIPSAMYIICYGMWFWRAKRNVKKGLSLPRTSVKSAFFRGRFHLILSSIVVVVYALALIVDAISGQPFGLFFLIIPVGGFAIGLWFKNKGLARNRSRGKNILIFVVLIIGSITITNVFLFGMILSQNSFTDSLFGISTEVPQGYQVLTLEDFGLEEEPNIEAFSRRSSIVVPRSYEYHEQSSEGTIRTHYYEAINGDIAEYIFEGMLQTEGSLYRRIIEKAPEIHWQADRAYYLREDQSMVLLLKDNTIIMIDGDWDFDNDEIVEISRENLGL